MDVTTREIAGVYAGNREKKEGASSLWNSLPGVYRQCAFCYKDFGSSREI